MKIKLYSGSHINSANKIFPHKIGNLVWHNSKWTDEEINECKSIDHQDFILNPSYENYKKNYLNSLNFSDYFKNKNDEQIRFYNNEFKNLNKSGLKILSIACGEAQRELFLAKNFNLDIVAIDNAPVTEKLNIISKNIKMKGSIVFKNINGKKLPFENSHFDYVISDCLIYCLEDNEINNFFRECLRVLKKNGINIISIDSRLSLVRKLYLFLKKITNKNFNINYTHDTNIKQSGYMRDVKHILKYLPKNAKIEKTHIGLNTENDFGKIFLKLKPFLIFFSSKIYPILGTKAIFKFKKLY